MATTTIINLSALGSVTSGSSSSSSSTGTSNTTIINSLSNPVPINSNRVVVTSELIRPNDTILYTAKDVIANSNTSPVIGTLTNMARIVGGSGNIIKARLMTNQKSCVARLKVHLFHTAPTMIPDNAPYTLLYNNFTSRIGAIELPALATEDSANSNSAFSMRPSSDGAYPVPNLAYNTGSSRDLYYIYETLDSFTPDANQRFYLELTADQN